LQHWRRSYSIKESILYKRDSGLSTTVAEKGNQTTANHENMQAFRKSGWAKTKHAERKK
jgi:hypothetical protein